jgi:uncharacterized protein YrrD
MMLASDVEGRPLLGAKDAELGTVERLLFHPSEPKVIGAMVRPPAALVVVARPETFLPLASLSFSSAGVVTELAKLPSQRAAAGRLGHDPDFTVIWTGMPVQSPSGRQIGAVTDVEFDTATGEVSRLEVAGGAIADAAHGRFVVPGRAVEGYATGAVHIGAEAGELSASGGLAKTAAEVAVIAAQRAEQVGRAVEDTVVAASGATGRAIKAVSDAKVAERTAKRVRTTWRDTIKAFKEGMSDDD